MFLCPSIAAARRAATRPTSESATQPARAPSTRPNVAAPKKTRRRLWDPRWRRVGIWDYSAAAVSFGLLAYVQFGTYTRRDPKWEGGILADDAVRRAFALETRKQRANANHASDVFWGLSWGFQVVDVLVVALAIERDFDLFWQLFWIDAEVFGIVSALSRVFHKTVSRSRPVIETCKEDPAYDALCGSSPASFFSGHTALTAAAAGLTCAHHQAMPLYGGGWRDVLPCVGAITTAAATGIARMMSDRHYLSDTLVGYAVGFLIGYGLPRLFHYHRFSPLLKVGPARALLLPSADSERLGLSLLGFF